MLMHWLFSFVRRILTLSQGLLLCGNSRWSENGHFKAILCCHPVSLRCWKQEKNPKPVSQQELEAAALSLGVLWILMTQTCGTVCLGTLWKEETRMCWAGIRCVLQAQWGWRAAAGYWWKTRLFSVRLLRGHFAGAAWGNNKCRWPKCVDMYLFDFFLPKTSLRWVEEGTCTARDVVNSSLCCSGLRKVLGAAVLRYWEVAAFSRLFPVSKA